MIKKKEDQKDKHEDIKKKGIKIIKCGQGKQENVDYFSEFFEPIGLSV